MSTRASLPPFWQQVKMEDFIEWYNREFGSLHKVKIQQSFPSKSANNE
jgi:hypothetical protein